MARKKIRGKAGVKFKSPYTSEKRDSQLRTLVTHLIINEEVKVTESKVINANGAKILLVDDNDLNIKVASTLLRKYNFNIDSVNSGFACIDKIEKVVKTIRSVSSDVIIMVDNCYCEFCSYDEPTAVGADIIVGSLIKNLGAGIVNNGAYIAGKVDLVELCAERLTSPGLGSEVGPSLGQNKNFFLGLYMAPLVVANALKVKAFTRELFKKLGFNVINENTDDIVLGIVFNDKEKLIKCVKAIQKFSAIDSVFSPEETDMPGYDNQIIMASGSFTDGSSIELSCDAPIRPPYVAFQQGGLTYEYGKIGVLMAINNL